ncbi:PadR family transcriptional regulator [Frondihabitans sp. PhB188]|uniref:PadR family transcriptional regulator n=1 Tax=Frondihabitans sp. PhB188 TaxID=2485200 RepID=UPI000F49445F|nr:PadR family transcriptional regulator [Frondihabitans sp. PhB188]ROQ40082.1 PadR family transcriptional regulator [Frondihabitans sp. PhB188]
MSSIRLFILDAFERYGEMHGHQLRLQAEQERISLWTDVSVGALYGALKRLASDGLLTEVRTEREGNFPERQVYAITESGRVALTQLRRSTLLEVVHRPDPFDLALARLDPERLDELPRTIQERAVALEKLLADTVANNERAKPWLSTGEEFVIAHGEHRLRSEIDWLRSLQQHLPAIVADEKSRVEPDRATP